MKRALALGGLAGVIMVTAGWGGCTQRQIDYFLGRQAEVAATETVQDDQEFVEFYNDLPDPPETDCKEWFWHAIDAGWTYDEWVNFTSFIMWRESRCKPEAFHPGGASGLMQVMDWWAPRCGITKQQLFDPFENLKCAKYIYTVQGKRAWSTWRGE